MEVLWRYSNQPIYTLPAQIVRSGRVPPALTKQPHHIDRRFGKTGIAQLCKGYEAGKSARELAAKYHISKTSVRRILQKHGIPLRHQGLTPDQLRYATELYQAGKSIPEVAKEMALSQNVVYYGLKQAGVTMRWGRHDKDRG